MPDPPSSSSPPAAIAIDAGALPLGGGLLSLVRPALAALAPGGVLAVLSSEPSVDEDLPAWCRLEHHRYLGCEPTGAPPRRQHLVARGPLGVLVPGVADAARLAPRDGRVLAADVLTAAPLPAHADPAGGFAPRGAAREPGGPAYPFALCERDRVAPPEIAQLYDQAVAAQWDGARDIPWASVRPLPPALDRAVAQVMTFLAENELAALYVPARFLPRIHPAFAEVAMFLATQLGDEARHVDVFLKRARLCGAQIGAPASAALGTSSVATSRSLLSLLALEDFSEAAFLLSVLGEGTFLDLLRFVERHAPDDATAELARRTRADEARHVHFGVAHVRHALAHDPGLGARLAEAVRRRAATLGAGAGAGPPAPLADALTLLAAGSADPAAVARGHRAFRDLLGDMNDGRVKRLESAGFTPAEARRISDLHTPSFM